ncbi:SRPBCC family protein [Nocardia aurantia]|uniref:Carbon monoxide dehydrogenase n=1 Tax=Nocardia aurantia TaxID=2585199 RepID=A0A7K0DR67_9NOCA|nr:SRPBCC family protein [Nocardia aurantia]MQY27314.1 hypothetical protein [Nocardia aurantia]
MKLENTFTIPVPAADAWKVLLDLERITPCVPGAALTGRDGDSYQGRMKVKLGPIGLSYSGTITIVSADDTTRIAVLEGGGREARGNGTANATITLRLAENNGTTNVFVDTDLNITGKPAQFGRGALAEVAATLLGQFATNLASELTSDARTTSPAVSSTGTPGAEIPAAAPTAPATPTTLRAPARPPAEPIDLLGSTGLRRPITIAAAVAGSALLIVLLRHTRKNHEIR